MDKYKIKQGDIIFINKLIGRDSLHCICRDLTVIAPCFERVLLQTVDFIFHGEQSG